MRVCIVLLAVILTSWAVTGAETYVVSPDGSGDFPTIQAAIDAAIDGDVIELTDGVFSGDGNRDILWWGQAIMVRSQSGDPESCIIDCGGSPQDPHGGFEIYGGGSEVVLEGVTITNGYAGRGGGIYIETSYATIINCILRDNGGAYGGGMTCDALSEPTIIRCTFIGNRAESGGGMCI